MTWHPYTPHFKEKIFPLIWAKPQQKGDVGKLVVVQLFTARTYRTPLLYARANRQLPPKIKIKSKPPTPHCACWVCSKWRRSVSTWRAPWEMYNILQEKTIAWSPCTPLSTVGTFSEKSAFQIVPVRRFCWRRSWRRIQLSWHENRELAYERILACKTEGMYGRFWLM